jgi:hypothetical protein
MFLKDSKIIELVISIIFIKSNNLKEILSSLLLYIFSSSLLKNSLVSILK